MSKFGRPDARIHFGATGKPGVNTRQVQRDEIGDLQLSVSIDTVTSRVKIDFGRPVTFIALPPDNAYDFAHLILEHVKDKQGGEPVNVTEDKIIAALAHTLAVNGLGKKDGTPARDLAAILLPEFMAQMAVDVAEESTPVGEAQP